MEKQVKNGLKKNPENCLQKPAIIFRRLPQKTVRVHVVQREITLNSDFGLKNSFSSENCFLFVNKSLKDTSACGFKVKCVKFWWTIYKN